MKHRDPTVVEVMMKLGPFELRLLRRVRGVRELAYRQPSTPHVDGERTPVASAMRIISNLASAETRKKNPNIAWVLRDVVRRMERRAKGEF